MHKNTDQTGTRVRHGYYLILTNIITHIKEVVLLAERQTIYINDMNVKDLNSNYMHDIDINDMCINFNHLYFNGMRINM